MSVPQRSWERWLRQAETKIALLERCQPLNGVEQVQRVIAAWRHRRRRAPAFVYAPVPDLSPLRAGLEALVEHARPAGPWGELYAARAHELALEAALVEALDTPAFRQRAARRYCLGEGAQLRSAAGLARRWCASPAPVTAASTHRSDDDHDPFSLVSAMRRAIGQQRLPFRVVVSPQLAAAAATGDGVIAVRAGIDLLDVDVRRIVVHEVWGHALPRHRAQSERLGLLRVGTAGAAADEEGRALLLERRAGLLHAGRRAELGWRHLAAAAVRSGADFVETVELLSSSGAGVDAAVHVAARSHRGGGLAREIIYLPALLRVAAAFSVDPQLELWLERGRVGLEAAAQLRELEPTPPPSRLAPELYARRGAARAGSSPAG